LQQVGKNAKKDFFNAAITFKEDKAMTYITTAQFLLQSCVILVDEELVGWLLKFAEVFADKLGTNLTGIHPVLDRDKVVFDSHSPQRLSEFLVSTEDEELEFS